MSVGGLAYYGLTDEGELRNFPIVSEGPNGEFFMLYRNMMQEWEEVLATRNGETAVPFHYGDESIASEIKRMEITPEHLPRGVRKLMAGDYPSVDVSAQDFSAGAEHRMDCLGFVDAQIPGAFMIQVLSASQFVQPKKPVLSIIDNDGTFVTNDPLGVQFAARVDVIYKDGFAYFKNYSKACKAFASLEMERQTKLAEAAHWMSQMDLFGDSSREIIAVEENDSLRTLMYRIRKMGIRYTSDEVVRMGENLGLELEKEGDGVVWPTKHKDKKTLMKLLAEDYYVGVFSKEIREAPSSKPAAIE